MINYFYLGKKFSLGRTKKSYREIMRRNGQIFDLICKTLSELNSIFSGPVLLELTINFFIITISAFTLMFSMTNISNKFITTATWFMLMAFITNWIVVVVLLSATEQPVLQVILKMFTRNQLIIVYCAWLIGKTRLFREEVFKISNACEPQERTAVRRLLFKILLVKSSVNLSSILLL